jgi:hypothetical protein
VVNLDDSHNQADVGRKLWKKLKGYHQRSLGETAMFRFKQLFGNNLRSRNLNSQKAEVHAAVPAEHKAYRMSRIYNKSLSLLSLHRSYR